MQRIYSWRGMVWVRRGRMVVLVLPGVMMRRFGSFAIALALCLGGSSWATEPLELDQTEHVEVQLVLLDVVVLDRRDRAVPDLQLEDFDVVIDSKPVEISSLDTFCHGERLPAPRAGEDWRPVSPTRMEHDRQVVLVFDEFHLNSRADALDSALRALDRLQLGGERHMVVSLGQALRTELPFTADRAAVVNVLEQMKQEIRPFGAQNPNLTEFPFYERMETLLGSLERRPGRKIVILFTEPFRGDGFYHDVDLQRIAATATRARAAIYPVDAGGMRAPNGFRIGDLGVPPRMNRLAQVTGGRVTHGTNDLALGYARAQRDLSCNYTIGFRDTKPKLDQARRVAVFVRRRGLRVVHPASYLMRSAKSESRARAEAALAAPHMYASEGLRAELVLGRPDPPRRWEASVVIELPVFHAGETATQWRLRGELRKPNGTLVERFQATDSQLPPTAQVGQFTETVRLHPGTYDLRVVLNRGRRSLPLAFESRVTIPRLPPKPAQPKPQLD